MAIVDSLIYLSRTGHPSDSGTSPYNLLDKSVCRLLLRDASVMSAWLLFLANHATARLESDLEWALAYGFNVLRDLTLAEDCTSLETRIVVKDNVPPEL